MASSAAISVTVKIPFSADLPVTSDLTTTVKQLLDHVLATRPPHISHEAPQCLFHAGRPLPEDETLADAGISDGAVLHLMRRSSHPPSDPTTEQNTNAQHVHHLHEQIHRQTLEHHRHFNPNNQLPANQSQNSDERHIHANVLIGHIAVDGRIQYDDAYEVLSSVLHAIGFAPPAVAAAASVAAAIAIANHSATDHGQPLLHIRDLAWSAARSASLTARNLVDPPLPLTPPEPHLNAIENAAEHPTPRDYASSVASANVIFPVVAQVLRATADQLDAFNPTHYLEQPLGTPSSRNSEGLVPRGDQAHEDAPLSDSNLSGNLHQENNLIPDMQNLPDAPVASDNAPTNQSNDESGHSFSSSLPSQPYSEAYELLSQLASAANTLTTSNALLASLLPDASLVGSAATPTRNEHESGGEVAASQGEVGNLPTLTRHIMTDTRTIFSTIPSGSQWNVESANDSPDANNPLPRSTTETIESPVTPEQLGETQEVIRSTEPSEAPPDDERRDINREPGEENGEHFNENDTYGRDSDNDADYESSSDEQTASNADFMVRLISCYLSAALDQEPLSDDPIPGEDEGWTAAQLLDSVYNPCNQTPSQPSSRLLRVLHKVMDLVTPRQFDSVCRGDMSALGPHRLQIWRIILESGQYDGDDLNEEDLRNDRIMDEISVEVYESIHEFIHSVERHINRGSSRAAASDGAPSNVVMHSVRHLAGQLSQIFSEELPLLSEERRQAHFTESLSKWILNAITTVTDGLLTELNVTRFELLGGIRFALTALGEHHLGKNAAILFPLVFNLFYSRVQAALDDVNRGNGDSYTWPLGHGNDQSDNESSTQSSISAPTRPSIESGSCITPAAELGSNETPFSSTFPSGTEAEMDDIQLDEDELDALALEFGAECAASSQMGTGDTDILVNEVPSEQRDLRTPSPTFGSSLHRVRSGTSSQPTTRGAAGGGALASSLASTIAGPFRLNSFGVGVPSSTGNANSRSRRATVTTTAVPRNTANYNSDEFEQVLGTNEGAQWRAIVQADEVRMSASTQAPLSRAYTGRSRPVVPLDTDSAAAMATENAKAAAQAARLPEASSANLQRVASENGELYLREYEKAVATRLSSDPDFDPTRFPNAAERFLHSAK